MADRNLPNRSLWIIAALVVGSGGLPGGEAACVSIAPLPGGGTAPAAGN